MRRRAACTLLGAGLLRPAAAGAIVMDPRRGLQQALAEARDGDIVEIPPGHHLGQAAVITQRRLTLRGRGPGRPVLDADGRGAEGKALLVVRHGDITIENLELRGCRVADGNGAGIRFERGRLTVERCAFLDNEMGLLSANTADAELRLVDCEFGEAPRHAGLLHHLLYAGRIARLSVTGCRFHGGWRGHLVKSRARESHLRYNLLADGPGGEASYELDLPNGGLAWVVGNVFAQGAATQNEVLVSFGAEGSPHAASALYMAHNTLVNGLPRPVPFVRTWPGKLPDAAELLMANNLMVGEGHWPEADGGGNLLLPLSALREPPGARFELDPAARPPPVTRAAGYARGWSLVPQAEFVMPAGTQPLPATLPLRPGALQGP